MLIIFQCQNSNPRQDELRIPTKFSPSKEAQKVLNFKRIFKEWYSQDFGRFSLKNIRTRDSQVSLQKLNFYNVKSYSWITDNISVDRPFRAN